MSAGPSKAPTRATGLPAVWLAFFGILIFAGTPVATRAGLQSFSPWFLFAFRSVLAAGLGYAWVRSRQLPRPGRRELKLLGLSGLGTVVGFPLLTSLAQRTVDASHSAVITSTVPLFTALGGAWLHGRRPPPLFWAFSGGALLLVGGFFFCGSGGAWTAADALILLASASVGLGYGFGALAAEVLPSEAVIAWTLILYLPLTLPVLLWSWPSDLWAASPVALAGALYLACGSMFLGFIFWFRALAKGGLTHTSQVQYLQPFLTFFLAGAVLGERPSVRHFIVAAAVLSLVAAQRRWAPLAQTRKPA